ncbi:MAG: YjcQ family protein [Treponema sp.]
METKTTAMQSDVNVETETNAEMRTDTMVIPAKDRIMITKAQIPHIKAGITEIRRPLFTILNRLYLGLDDTDFKPKEHITAECLQLSNPRWAKYLHLLSDAGYIDGVTFRKYDMGEVIQYSDIAITLKGMEFLEQNTVMPK